VLWAAGVQAAPIGQMLGCPLDRAGRVIVEPDCTIPGRPEVFFIGDLAAQKDPETGAPVPGFAPAAIQMGAFVARVLRRETMLGTSSRERSVFRYRDRGALATIGKAKAVVDFGNQTVHGLGAWGLWSFVHILFLIGFRNKLFVMLSWAWNYLLHTRGARLITRTPE
jgi:NADH dehydrogenase